MRAAAIDGPAPEGVAPAVSAPPGSHRTLAILTAIVCLGYMDRMVVGALAPLIKAEFGMSDTEMGLLIGFAFTIFYAIAGFPLARYADIASRRTVVVFSLAAWSAVTCLSGFAQSTAQLFLARVGVGIGEAGASPPSVAILSDLYPPRQRAFVMGIYGAGAMLGVMLGLGLGGWLGAQFGWRWAFILFGVPGLLLAVIAWVAVKEPARGASEPDIARPATPLSNSEAFGALKGNPAYLWIVLAQAISSFSVLGMSQWLPSFFVRSHDLSMGFVSLFFGFVFGAGLIVGQLSGGLWASHLAKRTRVPLQIPFWSCLMIAPCYLAALWTPNANAAVALTFLAAFLGGLMSPSAVSAMQTVVSPHVRSTAVAGFNFLNSILGLGLGVVVVGIGSDLLEPRFGIDSLKISLTLSQSLTVLAACLYLLANRSANRASGDRIAPTPEGAPVTG